MCFLILLVPAAILIHALANGYITSGRKKVYRSTDPKEYWSMVAVVAACFVMIIVYTLAPETGASKNQRIIFRSAFIIVIIACNIMAVGYFFNGKKETRLDFFHGTLGAGSAIFALIKGYFVMISHSGGDFIYRKDEPRIYWFCVLSSIAIMCYFYGRIYYNAKYTNNE